MELVVELILAGTKHFIRYNYLYQHVTGTFESTTVVDNVQKTFYDDFKRNRDVPDSTSHPCSLCGECHAKITGVPIGKRDPSSNKQDSPTWMVDGTLPSRHILSSLLQVSDTAKTCDGNVASYFGLLSVVGAINSPISFSTVVK